MHLISGECTEHMELIPPGVHSAVRSIKGLSPNTDSRVAI